MTLETNEKLCLVRPLHLQNSSSQAVRDEFDCPLAILADEIIVVPPSSIIRPVSVVHACSTSCKFVQSGSRVSMFEREELEISRKNQVTFRHDVLNKLYCINVYCTGNYL